MTVTEVSFFVHGDPAPQGNHRTSATGHTYETSKNHRPWREAIVYYAREAYHGPPLDGALELTVIFWFQRPKTAKKKGPWKTTAPDSSKLVRALEDALKIAGVIVDDSRICSHIIKKRYLLLPQGAAFSSIGADVTVSVLDNGEAGR